MMVNEPEMLLINRVSKLEQSLAKFEARGQVPQRSPATEVLQARGLTCEQRDDIIAEMRRMEGDICLQKYGKDHCTWTWKNGWEVTLKMERDAPDLQD